MHKRGVRDRSPFDPRERAAASGHHVNNRNFNLFSDEWIRRWHDPVPQSQSIEGIEVLDEHHREQWRLKRDVAAWVDSRPPVPQRYLLLRPDSLPSQLVEDTS